MIELVDSWTTVKGMKQEAPSSGRKRQVGVVHPPDFT